MQEMEARIWAYLDGDCPETEKREIENLISNHMEWKKAYEEALSLQASIFEFGLDEPSMSFTRNVMEEVGRLQINPAARKYINNNVIRAIWGFFGIALASLLVYTISQMEPSTETPKSVVLDTIRDADYSIFSSQGFLTGFILVNGILLLLLLDGYLRKKKENYKHDHTSH